MLNYFAGIADDGGVRQHPWTVSHTEEGSRYYDLKRKPALIPTVLEDFKPWEDHRAVKEFYKLVEWINGPGTHLEMNGCRFRGPHDQRKEVMRRGPYGGYYYNYEDDSFGELYSVPSDASSYTQAADIVAGFARQDYERYGIAAVAGKFDYVTLNGERITQGNAEAKFELWRQLIEQEKRNSQQQVIRLN
jgi:hypothetical protein